MRLQCRHVFHAACMEQWNASAEEEACPRCRGGTEVRAHFRYIDENSADSLRERMQKRANDDLEADVSGEQEILRAALLGRASSPFPGRGRMLSPPRTPESSRAGRQGSGISANASPGTQAGSAWATASPGAASSQTLGDVESVDVH